MDPSLPLILGLNTRETLMWIGIAVGGFLVLLVVLVLLKYGGLWFQAYMSNAHVSLLSLIGMSLRQVNAQLIVQAKIMAHAGRRRQRPATASPRGGWRPITWPAATCWRVIRAIIAAHRADIDLDFDRAAAIDLAGRDVLDAVQTSVNPKVIDCPDPRQEPQDDARARSPRTASS